MRKQDRLIWIVALLVVLLPLFVACGSGAAEKKLQLNVRAAMWLNCGRLPTPRASSAR